MKNLALFAVAMFICTATVAQSTQETVVEEKAGYSLFKIGISFPGDDLTNEKKNDFGEVGTGLVFGLKSYKSLETTLPNLWLVYGAELYYNGLSSDTKDDIEDEYDSSVDITFPMFFNLPVTIGCNYTMPLQNSLSIYGELAAGLNISYITKLKYEEGKDFDEYIFDTAVGFCYGLEAGLIINEKFHIGIRFNNLGSYKYKYENTYTDYYGDEETDKGKWNKLDVTNTALVLGIRF